MDWPEIWCPEDELSWSLGLPAAPPAGHSFHVLKVSPEWISKTFCTFDIHGSVNLNDPLTFYLVPKMRLTFVFFTEMSLQLLDR